MKLSIKGSLFQGFSLVDEVGQRFAVCDSRPCAELIVRAVNAHENAHEVLLAAAREAVTNLKKCLRESEYGEGDCVLVDGDLVDRVDGLIELSIRRLESAIAEGRAK